jgi:RNA polymerase sigma-70 factor (sigma-E family)
MLPHPAATTEISERTAVPVKLLRLSESRPSCVDMYMDAESGDFARFYAESRDDCLRTVLASTGDLDRAKDLVDEAFARAWASWRKVRKHPAPRAWIVRTALNVGVSTWRRRRHEVQLKETVYPADATSGSVVDRDIMAALRRLPERQRQVIALRLFLDLDTAGTAEVLGIAPGTVTAHLARAIATLREELAPARKEPDGHGEGTGVLT